MISNQLFLLFLPSEVHKEHVVALKKKHFPKINKTLSQNNALGIM
jgi:hypothetical protein